MRYYIADCHFFHESLNVQMDNRGFASAEELNAHMLEKWNGRVRAKDEVVILGDLSVGSAEETNALLDKLNGRLCLVRGNHDYFGKKKGFRTDRFEWIRDYAEIKENGKKVILCHYPIMFYNGQYRVQRPKTGGMARIMAGTAADGTILSEGAEAPEREESGRASDRSGGRESQSREERGGASVGNPPAAWSPWHDRDELPKKTWMLYGHVHDTTDERLMRQFIAMTRQTTRIGKEGEAYHIPCQMINCFCMFSDYVPLTLDEWIENDRRRWETAAEKYAPEEGERPR